MTATLHLDDDGIATIRLDDGGKNLIGLEMLAELEQALHKADDAKAIVIEGREGVLSAGLDLKHVKEHGPDGAVELIRGLGRFCLELWTDPRPTVCAATGHALAGGTILAMTCDHVVATDGPFKWGLVETAVNLEVPELGLALAAQRMQPRHVNQYVLPGTAVDAPTAVQIGYADELAQASFTASRAHAVARERMSLPPGAYAGNKMRLRGAATTRLRELAEADLQAVVRHLRAAT